MVKNKEDVRVEVDRNNRLTLISGIGAGPKSEKDIVYCSQWILINRIVFLGVVCHSGLTRSVGNGCLPGIRYLLDTVIDIAWLQHIAYSPLRSMKKELDKLPDVFKQTQ